MRLPRLVVVTDRTQAAGPLTDVVTAAVDAGARAVLLRDRDLPDRERAALAADLRAVLEPVGGLLVTAGAGSSDAVHLAAAEPFPELRPRLVGRSCHSAAELTRAREEGCDWAFLSPVAPTASKPGHGPALGVEGFARLARLGPPAHALGGVVPADVPALMAAGAHGVAVMGPVMRDPSVVAGYLAALTSAVTGS
ncbi:thiamine-phosphate pyrophosphorylase [Geodermatophilus bullaregiensis]|uniref:thiamine phosphate synthase n=1 Tax=Geodermatophilus bullaregiensis TaxID=1564160 RepID=UPI001959040C|nr:thiamine phosphate synthase [Geodermatophilus bullaregiensis]MBM7806677.1 thiamine-phosphate pyrophosphorylase [Geodermatophilus bullaregiensis]